MPCSFAEDVDCYARVGCPGMEVWLTKLEAHLEHHSLEETRQLVEGRGLSLTAASYQGGLLLPAGPAREAHWAHFRRRLELCQALNIPTLLVFADFPQPVTAAELEQALGNLRQAARLAAAYNVRLALEFRAHAAFCTSLATASALVAQCQEPNLGLNFDVFHYYLGPSKLEDLEQLPLQYLLHVQLCDLAGVPREWATDADRILPGEGDFHLEPIVSWLRRQGYTGWVALETFNPQLWQVPPLQVAEIGLTALRRVLGLARARC